MKGWKTYIVAGLMAATTAGHAMGYLDDKTFATIMGILTGGGFAALRAAVPKP